MHTVPRRPHYTHRTISHRYIVKTTLKSPEKLFKKIEMDAGKKNLIFLFEKCGSAVPAMPISFECGINIDRSAPETHTMWCVTTVILLWHTIRQTSLYQSLAFEIYTKMLRAAAAVCV